MERAKAISNLKKKHGEQIEIAKRLGLAASTVPEIVKPCKLPEDMQEEALKSGFWSRNKLLKLAKAKPDEPKKLFEDMKKDVAKKEALKLKKREPKDGSTTQKKPKIDPEAKKAQTANRKINAIKKRASLFSQRMQKEINRKWSSKDKKQLTNELHAVVKMIQVFLGEDNKEIIPSE
jgi:hypothetical protein